jgi:hypothetical protein
MGDQMLNFEASGALMDASLVMRDRETDSWWSIMTSTAIGGDLNGADLMALLAGEKATWKDWRQRHPDTLVLSVGGEEHVDNNPYDNYFDSEETFRGIEISDKRLEPKTPIYTFWFHGEPYAVPHSAFKGGRLFEVDGIDGRQLLLYRTKKGPIFESSRAYLVNEEKASGRKAKDLVAMVDSGSDEGIELLPGFDTFWYNWVAVNGNTHLIR